MADEQELTQVRLLVRLLGRHCPWAPEKRVENAAQLLDKGMAAAGVAKHDSFTMEMLNSAEIGGHMMARVLGPAPNTPGTPITPVAGGTLPGKLQFPPNMPRQSPFGSSG